jgi:hypothetical protein
MDIYVAEINGRSIAAVSADKISDAEALVKTPEIETELMVIENDGTPLWDGETPIYVRPALPEEQAAWRDFEKQEIPAGEIDPNRPEPRLCFLVPVVDPTDPVEILCRRVLHCS